MATIIFNGKSYNSLEEMPANEKMAYEQMMNIFVDADGNGIPDFLEGDMVKNVMTAVTSNISVNGQMYEGMNELPTDVREKIRSGRRFHEDLEKAVAMYIITHGLYRE